VVREARAGSLIDDTLPNRDGIKLGHHIAELIIKQNQRKAISHAYNPVDNRHHKVFGSFACLTFTGQALLASLSETVFFFGVFSLVVHK
jgi:hypothetical protein